MSYVLQAEQKCGTASSSNPKWGRRRMPQALHLICIKFTMSANWQSRQCVVSNLFASPNSAFLPQGHLGNLMLTVPGDLQVVQQLAEHLFCIRRKGDDRKRNVCLGGLSCRSVCIVNSMSSNDHPVSEVSAMAASASPDGEISHPATFAHRTARRSLVAWEAIAHPVPLPTSAITRSTQLHLLPSRARALRLQADARGGPPLPSEDRRSLGETLAVPTTPARMPHRAQSWDLRGSRPGSVRLPPMISDPVNEGRLRGPSALHRKAE
eukprot:CAMPEP_0177516284 /NCGR_PEP_ID=MMETSP0369-20130122/45330_1 /TAXON_ID=447022 ORGANISM="Scrippsiella hangoei-like, Strain SHHI-4" /NCGR_SAMPLE_ID=MMETSP0369 /ASSEMBLY_ACC=CAM_ASM_000364 /LENGTH=265 /DNA_ID=CAMNT_0018995155 /DNA_START=48 /DNA_END=846 /DNA_ORIENTATION=+